MGHHLKLHGNFFTNDMLDLVIDWDEDDRIIFDSLSKIHRGNRSNWERMSRSQKCFFNSEKRFEKDIYPVDDSVYENGSESSYDAVNT